MVDFLPPFFPLAFFPEDGDEAGFMIFTERFTNSRQKWHLKHFRALRVLIESVYKPDYRDKPGLNHKN